jgi:hypothetical protein
VNAAEKVVLRKKLRRKEMVAFAPNHAGGGASLYYRTWRSSRD